MCDPANKIHHSADVRIPYMPARSSDSDTSFVALGKRRKLRVGPFNFKCMTHDLDSHRHRRVIRKKEIQTQDMISEINFRSPLTLYSILRAALVTEMMIRPSTM